MFYILHDTFSLCISYFPIVFQVIPPFYHVVYNNFSAIGALGDVKVYGKLSMAEDEGLKLLVKSIQVFQGGDWFRPSKRETRCFRSWREGKNVFCFSKMVFFYLVGISCDSKRPWREEFEQHCKHTEGKQRAIWCYLCEKTMETSTYIISNGSLILFWKSPSHFNASLTIFEVLQATSELPKLQVSFRLGHRMHLTGQRRSSPFGESLVDFHFWKSLRLLYFRIMFKEHFTHF